MPTYAEQGNTDDLNKQVDDLPSSHLEADAQPALDMHKLDGQLYTVLKNRIQRGKKKQEEWWKRGKAMREFCQGKQWSAELVNLLTAENGWIRKTINKMKALRNGLLSQIAFQEPRMVALPLRRLPDFIGKATVSSTLINYSIKECDFAVAQKKAAMDALDFGAGALALSTNPEKGGIPGIYHKKIEDVVFDPDADTPEDAKFVACRYRLNLFAARKQFNDETLVSDRDMDKTEGKFAGANEKEIEPAPEDETLEVWEIWCRADAIDFMDADEADARNRVKDSLPENAPAALKYLTESGNRRIHISLRHNKILSDESWPFIIDNDMLPVWPVYLEEDSACMLPESPLLPAMGLQKAINTQITFLVTQAYTTAKIKFTGPKGMMADPQVQAGLKSAEVGTFIGTEDGQLPLSLLKLDGLNQAMVDVFKLINEEFEKVTGFSEMFGGMEGARSAAEAVIREDRAQTNSSLMRVSFESGLKRIIRAMWQIAMSTMTHRMVADIVGREEMGYVNTDGAVDADDTKNIVPVNWPYGEVKVNGTVLLPGATPAEIRRENFIEYVVNSTRRGNPQQEATDLRLLIQDVIGLIGTYTQQGYRINPVRMSRKLNYLLTRVLQAMGMHDYKQVEITPEDLSIDDRLMPRGQTEEQITAKLLEKQKKEQEQAQIGNVDALAAAMEAQGMDPDMARTQVAGLTPEQMAAAVQEIGG